jgi:hypothetical protein
MQTHLVIAVVALLAACTPPRGTDAPLPPVDPTRLSHEHHAQLPCGGCHRTSARPGKDDHRPCDDGACHRKAFLGRPTLFCQVCHTKVTNQPLSAPLKAYPSEDPWQSEPSRFSHKRHLEASRMEATVGFHVGCADCHTRDGNNARPDHATCSRCHAGEAALPRAPRMDDCTGCHQRGMHERTRARLIRDDLRFEHERHKSDRKGVPIKCETCHTQTAQSTNYQDHAAPRVQSCVGCHDDTDRTPSGQRMRICETCHKERTSTLTAIAPRSHLPATERPLDHTLAFRRDHAEVAERDASRCATCHTRMSGNPKQACDECHQTMQPADHRITWRELDHGPEAGADRDRCARCHVVEFCTACHAQRPRSHGLAGAFDAEHGRLARINIRTCLTCHGESFCATCHDAQTSPRRGRP